MDSMEWNKIFGALLAAAFVVLGLNFLSDGLFSDHAPEQPGFMIAGADPAVGDNPAPAQQEAESIAPLLASMQIEDGQKVARKCVACHNFDKGGANKVGPVLWDTVNRQIAGLDGFGYSNALVEYGTGKVWDYDALNKFLYKPKALVKGTTMGFAGLKKVEERAAIVAYLRSLSDNPAPLPDPAAAAETDAEATPASTETGTATETEIDTETGSDADTETDADSDTGTETNDQ